MTKKRFKLNKNIPIYYAGDDSGILIFSPLSATTLRLSSELKTQIQSIQNAEFFSKASWDELMSSFDEEASAHVWQNLISNKIVVEEAMDEG